VSCLPLAKITLTALSSLTVITAGAVVPVVAGGEGLLTGKTYTFAGTGAGKLRAILISEEITLLLSK
jgi:hypothetical protein